MLCWLITVDPSSTTRVDRNVSVCVYWPGCEDCGPSRARCRSAGGPRERYTRITSSLVRAKSLLTRSVHQFFVFFPHVEKSL